MLKVLVFDLDDTLFPERQFVWSGLQAVGKWIQQQHGVDHFFEVAWQFFEAGERQIIFNRALESLGISYQADLIQALLTIYRNHQPQISLHEDAQWIFDYFKDDKIFGLITNGALNTQQNKVRALGIAPYFSSIVYCGAFTSKYWKPSQYPYLRMMKATGYDGPSYLYVGDHPIKDFIAAKQLGWTTVRISRPDGEFAHLSADAPHDAEYTITSLYELKQIL